MPYSGIKSKKDIAKMDRCVKSIMADPNFRKKYKARIKKIGAKSLAIAICRKALKL